MEDATRAFSRFRAPGDQQEFVDSLADSQSARNDEHAGHEVARSQPLIGEAGHGGTVMGQHDAFSSRRPGKDAWIIGTD